jgi:hypothetical protein
VEVWELPYCRIDQNNETNKCPKGQDPFKECQCEIQSLAKKGIFEDSGRPPWNQVKHAKRCNTRETIFEGFKGTTLWQQK